MRRYFVLGLGLLLLASASGKAVDFDSQAFCPPNNKVTASVLQRFAKLSDDDNALTNKYTSTAGAVAYSYFTGPLEVGAAVSYEYGTRKYEYPFGGRAKLRDETLGVNLFGTYRTSEGWYGSGSMFVGYNRTDPKYMYDYILGGPNATYYQGLDTDNRTLFASSLEAGKVIDLGTFQVTPHVGLDYAYAPGERYSGTYAGIPATITSVHQNFFEIPVGVGLAKSFNAGNWVLTPNVDLTLVNSVGPMDSLNYYPGFSTYNGHDWKTYGISGGHIGGRVRAGLDAKLNDKYDLGVDYTYEGRKDYNDHRISALFGISF